MPQNRIRNSASIRIMIAACLMGALVAGIAAERSAAASAPDSKTCVDCHSRTSAALVAEWRHSRHAAAGVGCYECHQARQGELDAWLHHGAWVSVLVTPKDCSSCHEQEFDQFTASHHARAGEIIASLDNVLGEKACGMPGNVADAVDGCWQCHGGIVRFERDGTGAVLRRGAEGEPVLDADTWPNSGIGRLNPDGSRGSCNACHSRHDFSAALARAPENCGKCHLGPDHPQTEIYNESKHGIAFHAARERMALDREGEWVLGRDYSAAPTCATCHMGSHLGPDGAVAAGSHDVGGRLSWTLRPVVSTRLNQVVFEDGFQEEYPEGRPLPRIGDLVTTSEKYVEDGSLKSRDVPRKVARVRTWEDRRSGMKEVCANCHGPEHVDNFYKQYDGLVTLYNQKFALEAQALMDSLQADQVLDPKSPFGTDLQWNFYELWHHEGRRARHGAAMMGPDYTHWHGMYEVARLFYTGFLPEVVSTAAGKSAELGTKYRSTVDRLLQRDEHLWLKGLSAKEAEELRRNYQERYQQKQ